MVRTMEALRATVDNHSLRINELEDGNNILIATGEHFVDRISTLEEQMIELSSLNSAFERLKTGITNNLNSAIQRISEERGNQLVALSEQFQEQFEQHSNQVNARNQEIIGGIPAEFAELRRFREYATNSIEQLSRKVKELDTKLSQKGVQQRQNTTSQRSCSRKA